MYTGYWSKGMSHGKGSYKHKDGATFEGDWVCDKHHGQGREVWTDGAVFEGTYKDGKKNGYGRFVWPDGSKFEGDFLQSNYCLSTLVFPETFSITRWMAMVFTYGLTDASMMDSGKKTSSTGKVIV